jgi:hypothetical protein
LAPTYAAIDDRSNLIRDAWRPELRPVWKQEVVFVPEGDVRRYGSTGVIGVPVPRGRAPMFLHVQPTAHQRRLIRTTGSEPTELFATPTSSYRTVLAWARDRSPMMLKLSLGAVVAKVRRALKEEELARALIVTRVLDTIPREYLREVGLAWCPERAGIVHRESGHGWMLREFPKLERKSAWLVPAFSLGPWLEESIKSEGARPEDVVIDRLVRPYVAVVAHLLLEQGIEVEGHAQNVLFEVDRERLTGKVVLRDLADASIAIGLRLAKQQPLPEWSRGFLPRDMPFSPISAALELVSGVHRRRSRGALRTVSGWGMRGFLFSINESMRRRFPHYDVERVEREYRELWQWVTARYLGVRVAPFGPKLFLPMDEAILHHLLRTDWKRLGATTVRRAPENALPLHHPGARPRRERVDLRLECEWGELYLAGGRPSYFRPAF